MHHVKIATTVGFDGTTAVDLSNPTYSAPLDRYDFLFTTPIGIVPLFTLPEKIGGGNVDLFLQFIDVTLQGAGNTLSLRVPNGMLLPIYESGAPPPLGDQTRYNIIVPQGWSLAADDDLAGPGVLDLYLYEYGSAEWYLFQCCHIFTPIAQGPGAA